MQERYIKEPYFIFVKCALTFVVTVLTINDNISSVGTLMVARYR